MTRYNIIKQRYVGPLKERPEILFEGCDMDTAMGILTALATPVPGAVFNKSARTVSWPANDDVSVRFRADPEDLDPR